MNAPAPSTDTPRVSILLLCHKDVDYIDQAIAGALAQTVACEIIVSNDCSGDGTYERARALLEGYRGPHRVTLRCNARNLGVAAHVNAVVPLSSGEIVVMMAGDDVSRPDRVSRLLAAYQAHPEVMAIASDFEAVDAAGQPTALPFHNRRERFDLPYFVEVGRLIGLLGATLSFRREVFDRFGPIVGPIEDNALSLRAALLGTCMNLREPLVRYRIHSGSVSAGVFARDEDKATAKRKRYRRTVDFYRGTADDFEQAVRKLPALSAPDRAVARNILGMYRIEADAREALLDKPRRQWIGPIVRGVMQRGLRRKSLERAFKLLLPRRLVGL
ncbi:glycosyltransferase [Lysobacter pythonis]|uniref:Glycosyltransferase n=1 Tax=Solilutibacter pythonis TaxID=2483112 RepID=A0A3M2HZB0_9GAMM|nr:glycosyltransferase [Lysobacter pythonis]RMH93203.1 glycosyltransferase [Lysobacter pythonis]